MEKKVETLQYFMGKKLGITLSEYFKERKFITMENFIFNVEVDLTDIIKILDEYFKKVHGKYSFLPISNGLKLDLTYEIGDGKEQGFCILTNYVCKKRLSCETFIFNYVV